jgi:hypothetical protein
MKVLSAIISMLFASAAFAGGYHTGFCRVGEECGTIVSMNQREAQKICSREAFDKLALGVYQQQANGRTVFLGYVCTMPATGH